MAEFLGGEPISVGVDEPITFENKTDTTFDVGCGIVFRKSGLYRVSIVGKRMSVAVEPERKKGKWVRCDTDGFRNMLECSECGARIDIQEEFRSLFCYHCGVDMRK